MLRDYEIELLEKMVQEEQYKNNIPLCTPFIKDFLEAYKKLKDRATPKLVKYEDIGYDYFGGGDNVYACICPKCGLHIIEFNDSMIPNCGSDEPKQMFHSCMVHHGYMGLNQFCNRCGQALDWSKEDVCN